MKIRVFLAGMLACIGISGMAQDVKKEEPKGKAIVQVFGNFHSGFGAGIDDRGFVLDRSYLGYEYNLGNGLSVKGVMDIGQSNDVTDYHRIAYIKNAMVSWKKDAFTLNGGLISTTQFNFQEKFWGYRYIMKSFQDQYKFGNSADKNGYSIYASAKISKMIDLYARYDDVYSKDNWDIVKDESAAILGAQFKLGKYVKLAPNFRMSMPKAEGTEHAYSAYISCYFGL